jgi:hypothetical protein
MPSQTEVTERPIVARQLALALEHVDLDDGLVVFGGREVSDLRRNGRIPFDQLGHHTTERLEPERQWCYVQ